MIKVMDHVGLSVSNLERSIEFYRKGFGMGVASQGEFESAQYGGKYGAILGLRDARGRVAVLKVGSVQVELFEFAHPRPQPGNKNRPVCDHGITHFCIEVAGIDREYERLKAAGATFHCSPQRVVGMGAAVYGRDPDGNVFELFEPWESSH